MYIRKTVRRYKDKTYVNFLLVESVLTDKGPRQKVICSLGDLSPRPPEQWLALARKLQDALTGQLSLPGMADEDPELQQLRHVLPVQTAPTVDVDTTSTTTSSPGDLVSVHIDRVTYETPRPGGAWFNFSTFAGDKSWVAGVELATASEPPARKPRIWGRRPSGVAPSHPEV